jgi:signal transduction histidine kinase
VKQEIERHHGKISVSSEPGAGTTFHITLDPALTERQKSAA